MEKGKGSKSILMFPWLGHGHITSFLELAKRLTMRNFLIHFCSTAINLDAIKTTLAPHYSTKIQLLQLHFPSSPQLPPHLHTTRGLPLHLSPTLMNTFHLTAPQNLSTILETLRPDLLISDLYQPWACERASLFDIPTVYFGSCGAFVLSSALQMTAEVHESIEGLRICLRGSHEMVLVNSFRDLEGEIIDSLSLSLNKRIVPVGPLFRDSLPDDDDLKIMDWLDGKEPSSTVFVAFGSECFLPMEELHEIAYGLELSKVNFIWVVKLPKKDQKKTTVEEALPEGFTNRVGEKGMVVEDWAPQMTILKHRSVAAHVSHCGWNSILENMACGTAIVAIPVRYDQPFNAKLVAEVSVGVEAKRNLEGKLDREEIARVIKLVVEEKDGEEIRRRAREMSENIRRNGDEEIERSITELSNLLLDLTPCEKVAIV